MKTTKIILLLAIVAIPLLQSCKKEDYLTNAEKVGVELNSLISSKKIQYIEVRKYYTINSYDAIFSINFKIEGSFIKVDNTNYALENLSKYYFNVITYQDKQVYCLFLHLN